MSATAETAAPLRRGRTRTATFFSSLVFWSATLAILAGGVALIAHFFPMRHEVIRSATLDAPVDAVFAMVSDVERYPQWRSDITTVERLPDDGAGARFREISGKGAVTYRIESSRAPTEFRVRVDDEALPVGGWRSYSLASSEFGTELTVIETGEVYNPVFQLISEYAYTPIISIEGLMSAMRGAIHDYQPAPR
jgi:hypothetical protein